MSARSRSLAARTIVQMIAFVAIVVAATFGPAGTFDYAGGWWWDAIFVGSSAAITTYLYARDPKLLERRLAVAETGEPTRGQTIAQAVASIAFFGMIVVAGLDRRWQVTHLPTGSTAIGVALVLAGFAIVLAVFRQNTYASSVVTVEREQRVIDTGLYAYVRHPMYTGGFALIYGTPLVLGSLLAFAACPILTVIIGLRAGLEERMLARDLPGYAEYMKRVRYRFVPGVA